MKKASGLLDDHLTVPTPNTSTSFSRWFRHMSNMIAIELYDGYYGWSSLSFARQYHSMAFLREVGHDIPVLGIPLPHGAL
jgi:hypothetical protein